MSDQSTPIAVEIFHGQVDAKTPLFNRDPGWLKKLQNMRVKPGGYTEARGGYEGLRPAGGVTAPIDASATSYFAGYHEHISTTGVAVATANDGFSFPREVGLRAWFRIFGPADGGATEYPVLGTNVDTSHWWAFGSMAPFSRLTFNLASGTGPATYLVTWEYRSSSGGGSWQPLTMLVNEDFKNAGVRQPNWRVPSDWVAYALTPGTSNSIRGRWLYWVRVRITTIGASTQDAWNTTTPILSDWSGKTQQFAAKVDPAVSGFSVLKLYGQDNAGNAIWDFPQAFSLGWASTFANTNTVHRFIDYQNTPIYVNGYDQARFNGENWRPIGFIPPVLIGGGVTPAASAFNFGQACAFEYYITFGYGPNGVWGESGIERPNSGMLSVIPAGTNFAAGQQAQLAWTFATTPDADIDVVYLYRSQDLTGVPVGSRDSVPAFRIQTLPRSATGVLPTTAIDFKYPFPFPETELDIVDRTAPARCRFIKEFGGRIILASNDRYPNRAWWSKAGEGESFDQEEDFVELVHAITGIAVANDTVYLWSETEMIGFGSLDEDIPNIFTVPGGVGCVAGDAVVTKYGVTMWPSRDGIYIMGQDERPQRVTLDQGSVFGAMSTVTHGGSRAQMYSSMYDIHLLTPAGAPVGTAPRWRFDLLQPHWNESTVSLPPLAVVTAPLGHADFGVPHPIFGNVNPLVNDRTPYLGEYTTADAGAGFACIADIHFGPPKLQKFEIRRFAGYYQADAGWGVPVISSPGTHIWSPAPGYGTVVPKVGTDYKVALANPSSTQKGSQDIVVRFAATTTGSGAVNNQRLIAAYLDGNYDEIQPTG